MDGSIVAALVGLALADSLNPFTFAAQAYLLGTTRPWPRSLAFLLTTLLSYLAAGVLLLIAWDTARASLVPLIPGWGIGAAAVAGGLLLGGFGLYALTASNEGSPFKPPENLSVGATILFAIVSTGADVPTAVPYLAAVGILEAGSAAKIVQVAALGLYCLIYCLPLFALCLARALLSEPRSDALFGRMRRAVDWVAARLLPPLLLLAGAALLFEGARRLLTAG